MKSARATSSRKGVAFSDEISDRPPFLPISEEQTSLGREDTSVPLQTPKSDPDFDGSAQYQDPSILESSREVMSISTGTTRPSTFGHETDESVQWVQSKILDVKFQHNRPMSSGYHNIFVFDNGDRYLLQDICDTSVTELTIPCISYDGEWKFGTLSGQGIYTKADGIEKYIGHFENDHLSGVGEHQDVDGSKYVGGFKNGIRHGRGRFTKPGGVNFECEWRDGAMKGKVKKIIYSMFNEKTGEKLEGEKALLPGYINTLNQEVEPYARSEARHRYDISAGGRRYDFPEHKGGYNAYLKPMFRQHSPRSAAFLSKNCFVYKEGCDDDTVVIVRDEDPVYEGEQKCCDDGVYRRYGKGILKWGTGLRERYSGEWLYNEKHGKGERVWSNGEVYNGTWNHDKMEGKGSFRWPNGSKYNGEFVQGERCGTGVHIWIGEDGALMIYHGDWKHNRRNGFGSLQHPDGRKYIGQWIDGRITGRGTLEYSNGFRYEGEFAQDMKHGEGLRTELRGEEEIHFRVIYRYNVMAKKQPINRREYQQALESAGTKLPMSDQNPDRNPRKRSPGTSLPPKLDLGSVLRLSEEGPLNCSPPRPPPSSPTDNAAADGEDGQLVVRQHHRRRAEEGDSVEDKAAYTSNWTCGERE